MVRDLLSQRSRAVEVIQAVDLDDSIPGHGRQPQKMSAGSAERILRTAIMPETAHITMVNASTAPPTLDAEIHRQVRRLVGESIHLLARRHPW